MKSLYVSDNDGGYRTAKGSEICEAASAYVFEKALKARPTIRSVNDAKEFLQHQAGVDFEQFGVIYMDNRRRVLKVEVLFRGSVDMALVHPREVARQCIAENAACVMIFHNHPSGCIEPSPQDIQMTRMMSEALALLSIALVDHILVAGTKAISFVERGIHIAPPEQQE
jgi:DNA repair protein RadC